MPPTLQYNFTGPTSVNVNGTTTNFTITPITPVTDTVTFTDGGAGGTFTPNSLSFVSSLVAQTFTYTASSSPGVVPITPHSANINNLFNPSSINLTVMGLTKSQIYYQYPQFGGVPPFQIQGTNNQIPAANAPIVPPTVTSTGTYESGNGTITGLHAGYGYNFLPPHTNRERDMWGMIVHATGDGPFDVNYMFTTDNGATWYIGQQTPATAVTADGGVSYTYEVTHNYSVGFQFRFDIFNTGSGAVDVVWENRYTATGLRGGF